MAAADNLQYASPVSPVHAALQSHAACLFKLGISCCSCVHLVTASEAFVLDDI